MNILKRTLTPKSKWDLTQKYGGYTVGQLMEIHPSTLYWGYTHLEKIDFTDEVLTLLEDKFSETFVRINKPCIDKEQFSNFINKTCTFSGMSYEELKNLIRYKKSKGISVPIRLIESFRSKRSERYDTFNKKDGMTRGKLQFQNHGHRV